MTLSTPSTEEISGYVRVGRRWWPVQEYTDNRDNPLHPMNQKEDPGHFFVPAPKSGDSVVASTRISAAQSAMIGEVVASGQFPFKKPSDLLRSAIYYFLHDIIEPVWHDGGFSRELQQESNEMARAQRQKRLNDAERLLGTYVTMIGRLWRFGARDIAVQEYHNAEHALGQLPKELSDLALKQLRETPGLYEVVVAATSNEGGGE